MASAPPPLLASLDAHAGWLLTAPDALHVLMLFAAWDAPSQPGGAMDAVLASLAAVHPGVQFARVRRCGVHARARRGACDPAQPEPAPHPQSAPTHRSRARAGRRGAGGRAGRVAGRGGGAHVCAIQGELHRCARAVWRARCPSVLLRCAPAARARARARACVTAPVPAPPRAAPRCPQNATVLDRLEGADAAELAKRVERWKAAAAPVGAAADGGVPAALRELRARLEELVHANRIVRELPAAAAHGAHRRGGLSRGGQPRHACARSHLARCLMRAPPPPLPQMLFMKGSPEAPKCKFSRRAIELLQEAGAAFGSFDILTSDAVRQGLKERSNWPTYPQLYVAGEFVGGVDIMQELRDGGELGLLLKPPVAVAPAQAAAPPAAAAARPPPLSDAAASSTSGPALGADGATLLPHVEARLRALVARAPAVLFMKGTPSAPACGFSDRLVALLSAHGVPFEGYDILGDAQAREGLKALHAWPTFPQLVVHGKFVGGLDVLAEMAEEGPLAPQLGLQPVEPLATRVARLVAGARVVLCMKGTPAEPRCGFSEEALRVLAGAGLDVASALVLTGDDGKPLFATVDVQGDDAVRQGLKALADWPTFPQLWCEARFVGGLDIMRELNDAGELRGILLGAHA